MPVSIQYFFLYCSFPKGREGPELALIMAHFIVFVFPVLKS